MNIGIDISQIAHEGTGVARFTEGLIQSILDHGAEHRWTFFYSSLRKKCRETLQVKIKNRQNCSLILWPFPPTVLSYVWNTLHLLPIDRYMGPLDWFITSDWLEPPASVRKATIIHDLTVYKYPETVHPTILATHKKRLQWVSKESSLILSDSDATKKDVIEQFPQTEKKVETIYPGVTILKPSEQEQELVKKHFSLSKPFILTVGKSEPRKNLPRLLESFANIKIKDYELIIVGPRGWDTTISETEQKNVRFLGMVTELELHALYEQCSFFVLPSLWEGFGYPVLEAMLHHKAVITSNNSSLKEIGSKGSLLCDPTSVQSIQTSMETLMGDQRRTEKLSREGYEHAKQYTWHKYYQSLIHFLKEYENRD